MELKKLITAIGSLLMVLMLAMLLLSGCTQEVGPEEGPVEVEMMEWKMTTIATPGTFWHDAHVPYVEMVEEMSDGILSIELYAAETLYPVDEALTNVSNNVSEMSATTGLYFGGIDPAFPPSGYVMGSLFNMEAELFYEYLPEKIDIMQDLYGEYNVHWAGPWMAGAQGVVQSKTPIRTVADFNGLLMRSTGDGAAFYGKLGAKTIDLPATEIYTAAATGTIDAFELGNYTMHYDLSLHEVFGYALEPAPHEGLGHCDYIVNMDSWNELTPDLQGIIEATADALLLPNQLSNIAIVAESKQKMLDAGIEVTQLSGEEKIKIYEDVTLELMNEVAASSPMAKRIIDLHKEVGVLYGFYK
jgi:TRAP-type mannitol/chloroaromatic compound transport system substrate-binding protein